MDLMRKKWHRYHYKNLTLVLLSFLVTLLLSMSPEFKAALFHLGNLGYLGAFFAGILFVSTFTVSIGVITLLILAETLHPLELGIIAGLGGVLGDFIIFQFIRSRGLADEIKHFFQYFGGDKLRHLIHTKYFSWTLPVIGALLIASPLPDEIGVGLMGISRMKTYQFILLSFVLDVAGVFLVIAASTVIKP